MTPMLFRISCCTAVQLQGSQIANAAKLSSESDTSRLSELYVISAALCFVPSDVHSCKPAMFQVHCISIFKPLKLTKHHNLPSFMHGPRTVSQCLLGYILIVFLLFFPPIRIPAWFWLLKMQQNCKCGDSRRACAHGMASLCSSSWRPYRMASVRFPPRFSSRLHLIYVK